MDNLGHLTPEDEIFLDEDVLRDDYDPSRILERDDVLNRYLQMFSEVIRGKRPRNVFVYGPTGVGKTVGTHLVLDRVCEDADNVDDVDVTALHMECRDLNTSYQVAVNLVNVLRESTPRSSISTTGYSEGDVYDMLFDELRKAGTTHVLIALDEIDNIGTSDNVLYKLGQCNNRNSAKFVDLMTRKWDSSESRTIQRFATRWSHGSNRRSVNTRFTSPRTMQTNCERSSKTVPPMRFMMAY